MSERPGPSLEVHVPPTIRAAILEHARREAPRECCGLLVGAGNLVTSAVACENLLASPVRYAIAPDEYLQTWRAARRTGLDVVGAYHSHPTSEPVPSATDLADAAGAPFIYVIAGPVSDRVTCRLRAWTRSAGAFDELTLAD